VAELSVGFCGDSARAGPDWLRVLSRRGLAAEGRAGPSLFMTVVGKWPERPQVLVAPNCTDLSCGPATLSLPSETLLIGALQRLSGMDRSACGSDPARAGYDYATANFPDMGLRLPGGDGVPRAALNGLSSSLLGALCAGCRFIAWGLPGDPPAWAAGFERATGSERAVSMALGAGHAGARAMAVVSASEMESASRILRWAAEAEVPCVVLAAGEGFGIVPSMAEWVESAPAAFFVPATVEEAGKTAAQAFDWAETYQCPVCVSLSGLMDRWSAVARPGKTETSRGLWASPGEGRYRDTPAGISPRAVPGQEGLEYSACPADASRSKKLERKHIALLSSAPGLSAAGTGLCVAASGSLAGELRRLEGRFKLVAVDRLLPFPAALLAGEMKTSWRTVVAEWEGDTALRGLIRRQLSVDLPTLQIPRSADMESLRGSVLEAVGRD